MTTTPFAASMLLKHEHEPQSVCRERYDYLKKELEGRGLKKHGHWHDGDNVIRLNTNDGAFWGNHYEINPALLQYNPELLLAIAGQKPEGGVGCLYAYNDNGFIYRVIRKCGSYVVFELIEGKGEFNFPIGHFKSYFHLATIEELMTAFTCEEEKVDWGAIVRDCPDLPVFSNIPSEEKEPRKIRKGDKLLCVHVGLNTLTAGKIYKADSDTIIVENVPERVYIENDEGEIYLYNVNHFTNANANDEEDPVRIRKGDRLLCVDDSDADLITKGRYYKALTSERDDKPNICIVNDEGELDWFLAKRFTIVGEEDHKYKERIHVGMEVVGGFLEFVIDREGVYTPIRDNETTDVTDFIRYALQRHDQLKQQ